MTNLNRKVARFDQAAQREKLSSPDKAQKTNATWFPSEKHKVFEVQSEASGDGIYNCYEQELDADEWDDTTGNPKFKDANSTSIEVLNLNEHDPEEDYDAQLVTGDMLVSWRFFDNQGNERWVGIPDSGGRTRIAYCKSDAGAATTIVCYLDTDATGVEITVHCLILGGGNLNTAEPDLKDGDPLLIQKVGGIWTCIYPFQGWIECPIP